MTGKIGGILAFAIWFAYVGFLAWKVFEIPLLIITGGAVVLALVDLVQTEFQKREASIRRG